MYWGGHGVAMYWGGHALPAENKSLQSAISNQQLAKREH